MNLGKYFVFLTRVSDGETVEFSENFEVSDNSKDDWSNWKDTVVFSWEYGNFSCDCNRYMFFERALGKSEKWIEENDPNKCGHKDYRVNWIRDEQGNILYEEKE